MTESGSGGRPLLSRPLREELRALDLVLADPTATLASIESAAEWRAMLLRQVVNAGGWREYVYVEGEAQDGQAN